MLMTNYRNVPIKTSFFPSTMNSSQFSHISSRLFNMITFSPSSYIDQLLMPPLLNLAFPLICVLFFRVLILKHFAHERVKWKDKFKNREIRM